MPEKKRMILGVVAAEANNIEQRQILKGIIQEAQKLDIDTAVITNIYNPNVMDHELFCENQIYELILSPEIDAIIMISESFVNAELQQQLKNYLLQKDVPVFLLGTGLPNYNNTPFCHINTSDMNDIEDITDHLIDVHGFSKIDILSGFDYLDASVARVQGYKRSLEKHGIPYDEKRVFYGNFWMNSGEELAKRYISEELDLPDAIVCANDYMAYGLIDEFLEHHISVPQDVTVIGYEYVKERQFHSPILTTYQRNRRELGRIAVNMIYNKLVNHTDTDFIPPKGSLIFGSSCPCLPDRDIIYEELKEAREHKKYDHWNLYSTMDQNLTECRTLEEFTKVAGSFQWHIRNAHNIIFCLYENWHEANCENHSNLMNCRSIMPWLNTEPFIMNKFGFSEFFASNENPAAYYIVPIFSNSRIFGYTIIQYDEPDAYDDILRNWMKSVSNGLEFLRLKNDVNTLLECRNLSVSHEAVTGLFNERGLENELITEVKNAKPSDNVLLVLIKTDIFSDGISLNKQNINVRIDLEIAENVRSIQRSGNDICAKISDRLYAFAAVGGITEKRKNEIVDKLETLILHSPLYLRNCSHDSVISSAKLFSVSDFDFNSAMSLLTSDISSMLCDISARRRNPNYQGYQSIRNKMYSEPQNEFSIESASRELNHSTGYFRSTYREIFGISFHQDLIQSRVSLAKYLILTTSLSLTAIAEKCGYEDSKYFFRQFKNQTSMTPNQYKLI